MTGDARSLCRIVLSSALLLGLSATALAADVVSECKLPACAKTMEEVKGILEVVGKSARPEDTLIVFDIDNTLLKMKKDLGSDAWFNWQNSLLAASPPTDLRVGDNTDGLLNIQRLLYDLSGMEPPEKSAPEFVAELRAVGYPVMMLTGRGPGTMNATLRELASNKYIPKDAPPCGPPKCGDVLCSSPGIISTVAIRTASAKTETCFPNSQLDSLGRPVIYADGVLLASGQDKGRILKLLLASAADACRGDYATKGRYKAIVFIDDDIRNIDNVHRAFANSDMKDRVTTVRYGYLDKDAEEFKASDDKACKTSDSRKCAADRAWRALRSAICNEVAQFCRAVPSGP
jgi:hypothetical protein